MKKALLIVLAICLGLGLMVFLAEKAETGVANTPHDPRVRPGTGALHICESCHTPHSGQGAVPLWNRNRDHAGTSFTMYNSPTQDMTTSTTLLGYQSRLCFACHDGAVSTIVNYPGKTDNVPARYNLDLEGSFVLDTDLRNDHPVGFVANLALDTGDSGLRNLTYNASLIRGSVLNTIFPLFPAGGQTGTFQCATCHSVHHTASYDTVNQVYFLRVSNATSAMCRECHPNYY